MPCQRRRCRTSAGLPLWGGVRPPSVVAKSLTHGTRTGAPVLPRPACSGDVYSQPTTLGCGIDVRGNIALSSSTLVNSSEAVQGLKNSTKITTMRLPLSSNGQISLRLLVDGMSLRALLHSHSCSRSTCSAGQVSQSLGRSLNSFSGNYQYFLITMKGRGRSRLLGNGPNNVALFELSATPPAPRCVMFWLVLQPLGNGWIGAFCNLGAVSFLRNVQQGTSAERRGWTLN